MRSLIPLTLQDRYYREIEATIRRIFEDMIYQPILGVIDVRMPTLRRAARRSTEKLRRAEMRNSMSTLLAAIAAGDIWYHEGHFQGRFNARTSAALIKLGAKYNMRTKSYALPLSRLPDEIKFAQARADDNYKAMRREVAAILDNVNIDPARFGEKIKEEYEKTITRMEADLQKTLPAKEPGEQDNPAVSRIIVEANLSDHQKAIIAKDWGKNLELYIQGWAEENIIKLREDIQPHVLAGGRAQALVKTISDNYGVSTRKAKFLARQETALLMAKFQETRYQAIGIDRYRWATAHDERVRNNPKGGDHKSLDGEIFRFDSPPITNHRTGARNNPGQDFNCRCVAVPVFD